MSVEALTLPNVVIEAQAPMVLHALQAGRQRLPVVPLPPGRKFPPLWEGWPDRATVDPQLIGQTWQANPHANVGYTLAGLVAVDIDTMQGHGVDGDATWTALSAGRTLPPTREVRSPTGGRHLVFRLPDDMVIKSRESALGTGVDVKSGRGAYLVGPGSATVDGVYVLVSDEPPAACPAWLLAELRAAGANAHPSPVELDRSGPGGATFDVPAPVWERLGRFGESIPVGQRNGTIHRYACSLRARRASRDEAEHLLMLRFKDCDQPPGMPYTQTEALAALDSAWRHPSGSTEASAAAETAPDTTMQDVTGPPVAARAMFHGVLGEIVDAADPHTEADPVGVLGSLLAGVGAIVGGSPHLMIGSTKHPLLIYPLLFGRTGTGRKGEGDATAGLFLLSSYPGVGALTSSGLSSGEGLIERIRDTTDENDKIGTEDKRLLVIEPEFASVMARAKREGSTLAAVLRQAWDGKPLSVLNRSALTASSSHVAIVGHVTPREFKMRLAETEMSGGTYNRFLPLYVERSKHLPLPEPIPDSIKTRLGTRLGEGIAYARTAGRVTLGTDAREVWTAGLYDELTAADDEDAAWTEFTRRAAPYCLRIAAVHAVLDSRTEISAPDLDAAAALVRYAIASARYVLDGQGRDYRLDRIRRAVDGAEDGLTRTEISALFSRNVAFTALDALLTELMGTGHYELNQVATGGRPAHRYRRRPTS